MVLSLEDVKTYLRVDGDEEDALITFLIQAATELCEEILRYEIEDLSQEPAMVKKAILYGIANMYEKREGTYYYLRDEGGGIEDTMRMMRIFLSGHRKAGW
ncbi:head-tail connector protein [Salisediminibacterium selenitireducens]|uniref:Phage protein (Likely DNA packaging) n=1 Tax=Bacillus selenitireducens (strain ATCC 700615 / DSM 15326 / MLS10) TaxID=439292 RepID=D6XZY3_BACIE|nr:head-tail connector protein [Salisediminibacterium selenitireducens]ADI00485.1 putative phage protein (likely DNA packaging) [[Bacillus] selenitireducens MLS10]